MKPRDAMYDDPFYEECLDDYSDGYDHGYDDGFSDGYDEGYDDGIRDSCGDESEEVPRPIPAYDFSDFDELVKLLEEYPENDSSLYYND